MIHLQHLILEVTQDCNMSCKHCLRGEPRQCYMQTDTVKHIFRDVRHIEHLCLTGGEPSLAPWVIREIVYAAERWGCRIDRFFCSTNAAKYSREFVDALNMLFGICTIKDECGLSVSTDQFHGPTDPEALKNCRALPYYTPVKERGEIPRSEIVNMGRAAQNELGTVTLPIPERSYDYDYSGLMLSFKDTVYVNADGEVVLDADLSYEEQEENSIGNVKEGLWSILLRSTYIPKCAQGRYVFCLQFTGDIGTILSDRAIDTTTYYGSETKMMAHFNNALHNLFLTPFVDRREKPEHFFLEEGPMLGFDPEANRIAQKTITYFDQNTVLGQVTLKASFYLLEDAIHG